MGTKNPDENRLELPLPKGKPEVVVSAIKVQLAAVGSAADLPNQPKIKDALKATTDDVTAVETTLGSISTTRTNLKALLNTRNKQLFALRIDHEGLQTAINVAGKGDKAYLETYGGNIVTKNVVAATDEMPTNPTLKNTKISGEAAARCKADPKAYAYAYQFGTEPTNPDAWPKPLLESKSSYTATGLPVGQKVYCRIAVYRRGIGMGQWSPVLGLLVH